MVNKQSVKAIVVDYLSNFYGAESFDEQADILETLASYLDDVVGDLRNEIEEMEEDEDEEEDEE